MDDTDNLPRLHDMEKEGVTRLEEVLRELDGPMSVSNKLVPFEAYDVGDVDVRPNPRACDLGYPEGCDIGVHELDNETIFMDGDLGTDYAIHVDSETVVDDLSKWA